ncbi:hypothetical protein [Streptomyces sp. NPDC088760]|uniref:hypothetical protein n=1 Tax=Streptomyces sp. NPDC088760 TaxID=3365890 RepID=UPI0037F3133B
MSARHGRCPAALRLLQCVPATAELRRGRGRSMLATAGHGPGTGGPGADDAAAALVLHHVPAPDRAGAS